MSSRKRHSSPTTAQLAEISALADGTLPAERLQQAQASVAASPELTALLERERLAVARLTAAAERDRAPQALREQLERQRATRARRRPAAGRLAGAGLTGRGRLAAGLRGRLAAGLALAATVALVLALALPGGTPGAPSLSDAAALATRGAAGPAPLPDPENPRRQLARRVDGIYFPNWTRSPLRWRPTGIRIDRLDGHGAVTVFYTRDGVRVAYTILSAPPLRQPAAVIVRSHGRSFRALLLGGRMVVTWRRDGHTCVLSGRGVPVSMLARLAAWEPAR
jgi:hypothetical protein